MLSRVCRQNELEMTRKRYVRRHVRWYRVCTCLRLRARSSEVPQVHDYFLLFHYPEQRVRFAVLQRYLGASVSRMSSIRTCFVCGSYRNSLLGCYSSYTSSSWIATVTFAVICVFFLVSRSVGTLNFTQGEGIYMRGSEELCRFGSCGMDCGE